MAGSATSFWCLEGGPVGIKDKGRGFQALDDAMGAMVEGLSSMKDGRAVTVTASCMTSFIEALGEACLQNNQQDQEAAEQVCVSKWVEVSHTEVKHASLCNTDDIDWYHEEHARLVSGAQVANQTQQSTQSAVLEAVAKRWARLQEELTQRREQDTMEAAKAAMQSWQELKSARAEVATLVARKRNMCTCITQVQAAVHQVESATHEVESLHAKVAYVHSVLDRREDTLAKAVDQFDTTQQQLVATQQQLSNTQHKLQLVEQQLWAAKHAAKHATTQGNNCVFGGFSTPQTCAEPTPAAVSSPMTATFKGWSGLSSTITEWDIPDRASSPTDSEVSFDWLIPAATDLGVDVCVGLDGDDASSDGGADAMGDDSAVATGLVELDSEDSGISLGGLSSGASAGRSHRRRDSVDSCATEEGYPTTPCSWPVPVPVSVMDRECSSSDMGVWNGVAGWAPASLVCVLPAAPAAAYAPVGQSSAVGEWFAAASLAELTTTVSSSVSSWWGSTFGGSSWY